MAYVLLNEAKQTISYPPVNSPDGKICNYNINTKLLKADGYVNIADSLIILFNEGKGRIKGNTIVDLTQDAEYLAEQAAIKQLAMSSQVIQTSIGYLKKSTKVGDLLSLMGVYAAKVNKIGHLEAEKLWIYNADGTGFWNAQLTSEQFFVVFDEVVAAYEEIFKS